MDAQTLATAMGSSLPLAEYERLVGPFNDAMRRAGVNTVNRAAMWCAQIGHESSGLRYTQEIADGSAYEGRVDLGNTQPGDGVRFKGRGPIQVTGRHNYTQLSKWAFEQGIVGSPTYFVDNPSALEREEYLFLGAVWYWTVARPQLNELSDQQNVDAASYAVNGGYNGLEDRRARYQRCLTLGEALLPSPSTTSKEELSMADIRTINTKLDLILDQLSGPEKGPDGLPKHSGWPQLDGKTLVDAIAEIRRRILR